MANRNMEGNDRYTRDTIKSLKNEISKLRKSIFSSQLSIHEYSNRRDIKSREEKEAQLAKKIASAKEKVNEWYRLQDDLRNATLEGQGDVYNIESLSDIMELSPFISPEVSLLDEKYEVKSKGKKLDYRTIPDEKKLYMSGAACYYITKADSRNVELTDEEIKAKALQLMAQNGIETRKHNHKSKEAKKIENVAETVKEEPTRNEIYKVENDPITFANEVKLETHEGNVKEKEDEVITPKEVVVEEPTGNEIYKVKEEPVTSASETEHKTHEDSVKEKEDEVITPKEVMVEEPTGEEIYKVKDEPIITDIEETSKEEITKSDEKNINEPVEEIIEKAEPSQEPKEFEDIYSNSNYQQNESYDYRKNLPTVRYSDIDEVEKLQKGIQSKICDKKGKFISSESGKVRRAIRRVAIATNSKDIDATELLNSLYSKKGFFNRNTKISSKNLPNKLNMSFESFKEQFYAAIDSGELSKEDQDVIYEYMIRPRELVEIKEEIKNGNIVVDEKEEIDNVDISSKFYDSLERQTEKLPEIDIKSKGKQIDQSQKEVNQERYYK